jgi:broad specificity phosphatase PhoE
MKLIVVRHGETPYNKSGRLMGHLNVGLSGLGKQQAKKVSERLAQEPINFIYCSDLDRCIQTLEHIREKFPNLPVHFEQSLRERNLGVFEGKAKSEVDFDSLPGTLLTRRPPKGEALSDVKNRVKKFLNHLETKHVGESVLLVTHGGIICMLHHLLSRDSLEEIFANHDIGNTALSMYEVTGRKPIVHVFNDTSHL